MRNLWRLLEVLTGQRFRNYLMAEANDLHNRAAALTRCMIVVGILAVVLNLYGLKTVNFYLSMLVNIIMIIVMTRPSVLLTIGLIGVATDQSLEGGKELLKKAANIYANILLYISVVFLFSGIFSFRNNPGAVAMIIAALLVTFWADKAGWFKPVFYRKAIYVFANCAIIFGILSFIPRAGYIKIVGFYPYSFLAATGLEDKISDVEEAEIKAMEKVAIKKLEGIEGKINDGQKLSEEEENFWNEQRAIRNSNTIFSQAKNSVSGLFSSPAPAPEQKLVQRANLNDFKVYRPRPEPYHFSLKAGEQTDHWIAFPVGDYKYNFNSGGSFKVIYDDGEIVDSRTAKGLPKKTNEMFKIQAINDQELEMNLTSL